MADDFHLDLSEADMNALSEALGNMPFKAIAPLVNKINQQVGAQLAAKAKASLPEAPAAPEEKPRSNGVEHQPQA